MRGVGVRPRSEAPYTSRGLLLALLQFDATSLPLIQRMLDDGHLPALAGLLERGRWHELGRSSPMFVEAGSYVSLYSGDEVGDHGIYSAFQWSAGEQRLRFMDRFPVPTASWERLSRAGRRSLVIDPYESWRARETAGLRLLNGWQFKHKLLLSISRPRRTKRMLSLRFGRPPTVEHHYDRQPASRLDAIRGSLLAGPGRAADAVCHLLAREPLELVWVTFSAAHYAGHYYWDLSRTVKGDLDPDRRKELEATVRLSYEAVDEAIGRIVAALPADASVIAFSPIGMGAETTRSDLLPDMLAAVLGGERRASRQNRGAAGSTIWRLRAAMPGSWRSALARPLPGPVVRDLTARLHLRGTDWSRTRAFALPGDHHGYVRLNLKGRERSGIVDPTEKESLIDEIATGLAGFRDPDGARAVAAVHRVEAEIEGERVDQLPDLVVRWPDRPTAGLPGVTSPDFGDVVRHGVGTGRSGNHDTEAWVIVSPGDWQARDLGRQPRITDIPATACEMLQADTAGLSGESLLEPA
jgi:predicted AlkP superfamily phosphohydrolase/phosphomutase